MIFARYFRIYVWYYLGRFFFLSLWIYWMNSTPSPTFATSWENINPIPAAAASAALSSAGYTFFLFLLDDTFLFLFFFSWLFSQPTDAVWDCFSLRIDFVSFRRDSLSSFAYVRGLPMTMSFAVCVLLLLSFRVRRAISEQIEHTRTHCRLARADGGRREELADDESSSIEKALSDWMVIERNERLFSTTCYLLLHGCFCYYHPTRRHVSCECPILGSWILSSHCVYEAYQIPAAIHYTISARVWWESWTGPSLMVTL